ncbi:MAG: 50S ribosomal protein L21 [Candidatus Bipolaricaulia bacterium]
MYAVIEAAGRQYLVEEGEELLLERLPAEPGATVDFTKVLLIGGDGGIKIGRPYLPGAKVIGRVLEEIKGEKIRVFTYKSKTRYRRRLGQRQLYTKARIEAIQG